MKKIVLIIGLAFSISAYSQDTIATPVMTQVEVQKHITNAFDSVNLIVQLNALAQPLSVDNADSKVRNVGHLKVMMAKEWFFNGLTFGQKSTIESLIL